MSLKLHMVYPPHILRNLYVLKMLLLTISGTQIIAVQNKCLKRMILIFI